jgi:hypothetical protein
MNLPSSLYEAIVRGFGGTGEVGERRALFLFLVDHSDAMQRVFAETGRSRIASVVDALNEMKREMARADCGDHLDIGFIGYPIQNGGTVAGIMWSANAEQGVIRPVADHANVEIGTLDPASVDGATNALEVAREQVSSWVKANDRPLFNPVVVHIVPAEHSAVPGIEAAAQSLTAIRGTCLFHCCFDERSPDNVVIPKEGEVPAGLASQLFAISSEMPPLVEDVGELLQGRVSPRLRQIGEDVAQSYGVPRGLASLGADLVSGALHGGIRMPTRMPGWSVGLESRVDGLCINSRVGFALVRGMVGFRIFVRLFN